MKLELTNISKSFPGIKALNNVNFYLKQNSVHGLIGENGAGKSTLVKILCGVYQPEEGKIKINQKEVNLDNIKKGSSITVKWRGKPIFIKHRTDEEIKEAQEVNIDQLKDPQKDQDRVVHPEWLVIIGICTHLGCIPSGQKNTDTKGDFNGWFCPCHGSHYDSSGRIRKGPAPKNLQVPKYTFINKNKIRIG